ncbi:cytochrome P450 [Solirubrobacter sp. CPCC 204708]|uniref:Cytochrome P450 n=1 Tax=Solirubrobacter deserti TaxID=2282478 RepID=A0ABT4RKU8_9ACTN|nr:cytochrome P450 [Solirubrobacter deserti]MBE2319103.1 cytochrome P450 [Solirubrobacter deserti]MDA0139182.1 cytochrome P450 [Solirubrobacter deserti]
MLPPGPKAPSAFQTIEWIVRPTHFLRQAQAKYGEPFTIRTAWSDAPMVLTSDPEEIKRAYAAPPDVLQGGDAADFLEPFVGRNSLLVLHGDEHLKQRRLVLPPFHGEALRRWSDTISTLAHAHLDTWPTGTPFRALPRMQELTLEIIQRVIFGSQDAELKHALRSALDLTQSTPNLIAMSLVQRDFGPYGRFLKAVERIDELVYARIDQPSETESILDLLKQSGATREELRDQLVTLLAAGHETTATALAWALERLARHPADLTADPQPFIDEVLRTRPVLSITARKTLQPYTLAGHTLPEGVYVAPCIYLANRRGKPIPFGGGTRRCVGAAFATLELREVLRAVSGRFRLRPPRAQGERMRRRSITLAPARGAEIIADPLA